MMFEATEKPRVFALPVGCDFSRAFIDGLTRRMAGKPPEALARIEVFVNTRRTERRLHHLLLNQTAGLLPRVRVITDLARDPLIGADIPPPVSPLRRQLELSRAIATLLDHDPSLAPRSAIFDLAESLAALMDEMQGEGVHPDALNQPETEAHAEHWQRNLKLLNILTPYFADTSEPGVETRQRLVVEHLARLWQDHPPDHPVIVAGSTGSRGTTAMFMRLVAKLPQGAVVLPGFDFEAPAHVLDILSEPDAGLEHPQTGLVRFLQSLDLETKNLPEWSASEPANPPRNRLVSLALRPAPTTDHWLVEGPKLRDLETAVRDLDLLEADSSRQEALAIALRLRAAVEDGQKATLITPDRTLTRQVSAALSRWNISPDDSAGQPLALTPPGIFLGLTARLLTMPPTSEALLALLKHPLSHSGSEGRNRHLLRSRELELEVLRGGPPFPDFTAIAAWAAARKQDEGAVLWVAWLKECFTPETSDKPLPLSTHIQRHLTLAGRLSDGPEPSRESGLWQKDAGVEARRLFADMEENANAGGAITPSEFGALLRNLLGRGEVHEPVNSRPDVTIWGTLEARVQGADLVILGGLNDGVWPKLPPPDPWLNRSLRKGAGLLLPERRIGLAAHDFQQAIAAPKVLLSRAVRDAEAPTVPSRWLTRLTHLLAGLGDNGDKALADMRARGQGWRTLALALEKPRVQVTPAPRPSPRPPVEHRPKKLSVTRIKTLIRDPYAIYASRILRLRPLDPLRTQPDALLKGIALHKVMEKFANETAHGLPPDAEDTLLSLANEVLLVEAPWPAARRLWLARLARIGTKLVADERVRRAQGIPIATEIKGVQELSSLGFTLTAEADRIDRTTSGGLIIYDYKTGAIPTNPQIEHFDKQLPLEAAMAEQGAFKGLDPAPVQGLFYIGLGSAAPIKQVDISDGLVSHIWQEFQDLIKAWQMPQTGYTARARMEKQADPSDYDHLSRFGEWDASDLPNPEDQP